MITYSDPQRLLKGKRLSKVYYTRTYDDGTGGRSWKSTGCRSYQAARQWVRTQEMNQALGKERLEVQAKKQATFGEAYSVWIKEKEEKVSDDHFINLKSRGDSSWIPFFGKLTLEDLTPDLVSKYLQKRRAGTIRKPGDDSPVRKVSATTLNNDLRYLGSFLGYCRDCGWLSRDPLRGLQRYSGAMKRRTRAISEEEEEKLLKTCLGGEVITVSAIRNKGGKKGGEVSEVPTEFSQRIPAPDYLYPLVLVALKCGFRRRTLLGLRWRDIDLERGEWDIPAELIKTAEDYDAPVSQMVVQELKAYRQRLTENCKEHGVSPVTRLGPDSAIFGLSPRSSIRRSFHTAARRAGLKLTFHDLRRIFLNRLRERGVSIETAMALTGHKGLQTVLTHYRQVPRSELRNAVDALDRSTAISGNTPAKR